MFVISVCFLRLVYSAEQKKMKLEKNILEKIQSEGIQLIDDNTKKNRNTEINDLCINAKKWDQYIKSNSQDNIDLFNELSILWITAKKDISLLNALNPSESYKDILSILNTFPFLLKEYDDFDLSDYYQCMEKFSYEEFLKFLKVKSNNFELLLRNGVVEPFPYKKIVALIGECFPSTESKTRPMHLKLIIEKNCKRAAQLIVVAQKIASEEKKENRKENLKLQDIFLSFQSILLGLDEIRNLFLNRIEILSKINELVDKEIIRQEEIIIEGEKKYTILNMHNGEHLLHKEIKNMKSSTIFVLREKILKLLKKINKFHKQDVSFILSKKFDYVDLGIGNEKISIVHEFTEFRKKIDKCESLQDVYEEIEKSKKKNIKNEKMQEFKALTKKIMKKNNLLLCKHHELKKQYKFLFCSHGSAVEELNIKLQEEDKNFQDINKSIFEIQSMIKVFLVMDQLSKYFLEMTPDESIESIKKLTSDQLVGFVFFIYIGNLFKKYIQNYEDKEDRMMQIDENYPMKNIIEKIQKSDSNIAEKILYCVEKMDLEIFTQSKETFLKIFEDKEILRYKEEKTNIYPEDKEINKKENNSFESLIENLK